MRAGGFDAAHPIKVRKNGKGYEILGGHMRCLAAESAGLSEVPCVVVKLSDRAALLELAHDNAQRIWHPLDVGQHVIDTGLSVRKYMRKFGLKLGAVQQRLYSARVHNAVKDDVNEDLRPYWRQLAVIYSAPRTEWVGLVERVIDNSLNADGVRRILKERKAALAPRPESDDDGALQRVVAENPLGQIGDQKEDEDEDQKEDLDEDEKEDEDKDEEQDEDGDEDYRVKPWTPPSAPFGTVPLPPAKPSRTEDRLNRKNPLQVLIDCVRQPNVKALYDIQRVDLLHWLILEYNIKVRLVDLLIHPEN